MNILVAIVCITALALFARYQRVKWDNEQKRLPEWVATCYCGWRGEPGKRHDASVDVINHVGPLDPVQVHFHKWQTIEKVEE